MERVDSEKCYVDPATGKVEIFPSIHEAPTVELSVIVPAYEEEKRLPKMLDACIAYLEAREKAEADPETKIKFSYEIIVVDDGSADKTSEAAFAYVKKYGASKIRVLTLAKNRGKGGAVYMGMMSCRGKYVLFADADGASEFADVTKLEKAIYKVTAGEMLEQQRSSGDQDLEIASDGVAMPLVDSVSIAWEKPAIAVGSRAHLEKQSIASRSFARCFSSAQKLRKTTDNGHEDERFSSEFGEVNKLVSISINIF
jgi:dolichyl-phosphate beta-glucosyltransferase